VCASGAYHQFPRRQETGVMNRDGALAQQLRSLPAARTGCRGGGGTLGWLAAAVFLDLLDAVAPLEPDTGRMERLAALGVGPLA
jgi:hypothetical protein